MARLGATIHHGAEGSTLTLGGEVINLRLMDRHQVRALASNVSDALGIQPNIKTPSRNRSK